MVFFLQILKLIVSVLCFSLLFSCKTSTTGSDTSGATIATQAEKMKNFYEERIFKDLKSRFKKAQYEPIKPVIIPRIGDLLSTTQTKTLEPLAQSCVLFPPKYSEILKAAEGRISETSLPYTNIFINSDYDKNVNANNKTQGFNISILDNAVKYKDIKSLESKPTFKLVLKHARDSFSELREKKLNCLTDLEGSSENNLKEVVGVVFAKFDIKITTSKDLDVGLSTKIFKNFLGFVGISFIPDLGDLVRVDQNDNKTALLKFDDYEPIFILVADRRKADLLTEKAREIIRTGAIDSARRTHPQCTRFSSDLEFCEVCESPTVHDNWRPRDVEQNGEILETTCSGFRPGTQYRAGFQSDVKIHTRKLVHGARLWVAGDSVLRQVENQPNIVNLPLGASYPYKSSVKTEIVGDVPQNGEIRVTGGLSDCAEYSSLTPRDVECENRAAKLIVETVSQSEYAAGRDSQRFSKTQTARDGTCLFRLDLIFPRPVEQMANNRNHVLQCDDIGSGKLLVFFDGRLVGTVDQNVDLYRRNFEFRIDTGFPNAKLKKQRDGTRSIKYSYGHESLSARLPFDGFPIEIEGNDLKIDVTIPTHCSLSNRRDSLGCAVGFGSKLVVQRVSNTQ